MKFIKHSEQIAAIAEDKNKLVFLGTRHDVDFHLIVLTVEKNSAQVQKIWLSLFAKANLIC